MSGYRPVKAHISPPRKLQEVRSLVAAQQVDLPPKVEKVLRFALEHPADTAFSTTGNLASQCCVSSATVVRLSAILGFDSFHDFRELFRSEIRNVSRWQDDRKRNVT